MTAAEVPAPVPSLRIIRDEVDAGLHKLVSLTKDPSFASNPTAQSLAVRKAASMWWSITPQQREQIASFLAPRLPRCLESPNPELSFNEIVQLGKHEDIDRALLVRAAHYDNWICAENEQLYPTAGLIGNYLRATKCSVVPLGFHFWAMVCLIGAVLKRNVYYEGGSFRVWPHWYVVLAGDKATGKGAALEAMMDTLLRFNTLCGPEADPDARLRRVHLFPNDTTPEHLMRELGELCAPKVESRFDGLRLNRIETHGDAAGLLALGEMGTFFGRDNWNADKKPMFLTDIKESDHYCKGTLKDGRIDLYNLAVSMLGCCAPVWLKSIITPETVSGGTADRTTYVFRHPVFDRMEAYPPGAVPPRDPLQINLIAKQLTALAGIAKTPAILTRAAQAFMRELNSGLVEEKRKRYEVTLGNDEGGSLLRTVNNVVRLGMILATSEGLLTENALTVDGPHVELAWTLLKLEDTSLEQFMQYRGVNNDVATHYNRIKLWILRSGGCALSSSITQKFFRVLGTAQEIRLKYLGPMVSAGELELVVHKTISRKGEWYRIPEHKCEKCEVI